MIKTIVFSILLLYATSVYAEQIDFSTILNDIDGKTPIKDAFPSDVPPDKRPSLTLGLAAAHALLSTYQDETATADIDKWRRGELAIRVSSGAKLALPAEDVALIKHLVAKLWGPIVVYRAWPLLDPSVSK
jgi:hypothetical protein